MKKKQVKKKQRSLAADIQTVLLWVLRGISFFYLIMMGVVMPFYYHPETSYMTIGSGKAEFYNKWAFGTAKAAGVLLLLYLLTASVRQFASRKEPPSTMQSVATAMPIISVMLREAFINTARTL